MIREDGVRLLPSLLIFVEAAAATAAPVRLHDLALDEESEISVLEPSYVYVRVHRRVTGGERGRFRLLDKSGVRPANEIVQFSE